MFAYLFLACVFQIVCYSVLPNLPVTVFIYHDKKIVSLFLFKLEASMDRLLLLRLLVEQTLKM